MATGRTTKKWAHAYIDNYLALHQGIISAGPLTVEAIMGDHATWADAIEGGLPTGVRVSPGVINGVLESGIGSYIDPNNSPISPGAHVVTVSMGIRGTPAQGDPAFCGYFRQLGLTSDITEGAVTVNMSYGPWDPPNLISYIRAWGNLVHPAGTETAANSAAGFDNPAAASTTAGGYMLYHISGGTGTLTLSIDDSADNSNWVALSGATTGSITQTDKFGIVSLGTTATVRRYLRWQLAKGTASTTTFALAFVRG